jgi:hypothetical protein
VRDCLTEHLEICPTLVVVVVVELNPIVPAKISIDLSIPQYNHCERCELSVRRKQDRAIDIVQMFIRNLHSPPPLASSSNLLLFNTQFLKSDNLIIMFRQRQLELRPLVTQVVFQLRTT